MAARAPATTLRTVAKKHNDRRRPEARLDRCAELLATCMPHHRVEEMLAHEWHMTRRAVRNYILDVYKRWEARREEQRPFVRAELEQGFRAFYQRAMAAEEYRAAVVALDRLAKLHGAYEPDRVEVTGAVGVASIDVADPEAVRARIAELVAKHPEIAPPKRPRKDTE